MVPGSSNSKYNEITQNRALARVCRTEHSNQHIHIKKRDTQSSSRNAFTTLRSCRAVLAFGTNRRTPFRTLGDVLAKRDCRAQVRDHVPNGSALLAGHLFCRSEHIVIDFEGR
jgi:hypothetical protein